MQHVRLRFCNDPDASHYVLSHSVNQYIWHWHTFLPNPYRRYWHTYRQYRSSGHSRRIRKQHVLRQRWIRHYFRE